MQRPLVVAVSLPEPTPGPGCKVLVSLTGQRTQFLLFNTEELEALSLFFLKNNVLHLTREMCTIFALCVLQVLKIKVPYTCFFKTQVNRKKIPYQFANKDSGHPDKFGFKVHKE